MMMNPWIDAIRPKTLIAAIAPVIIGTILSLLKGPISLITLCFTLVGALSIQILTNLANDYFDFKKGADTKDRIGPTRVMQAGLVTNQQMLFAISLVTLITALSLSYLVFLGGFPILFLSVVAILLAVGYTTGPLPLAYLGLGDLFVIVFFGTIATSATYYLQTTVVDPIAIIIGTAIGFFANTLLVVNNLRDYEQDLIANKKTLVVRFGLFFGKAELFLCYLMVSILTIYTSLFLNNYYINFSLAFFAMNAGALLVLLKPYDAKKIGSTLPHHAKAFVFYTLILCATLFC